MHSIHKPVGHAQQCTILLMQAYALKLVFGDLQSPIRIATKLYSYAEMTEGATNHLAMFLL